MNSSEKTEIESVKTSLDEGIDMIAMLKEMLHYSQNNIEKLAEMWLFMEDEVKRKDFAKDLEELQDRQGSMHQALEKIVNDLELETNRIINEGGNSL
ncbi:MAG: hypothetical protein U9R57_17655 [Thermodesulfobacteriota bacterium]|nr:hypothetical protein [Thermodesulfobacteriota bacterium]